MTETVMIVAPARGGKKNVQRSNRCAPRKTARFLEPFCVLHRHGRGDHGEGFVGHIQPVPPREQVTFEPAFAQMLAQDFHHTAVSADVIVDVNRPAGEAAILDREHVA